MKTKRTRRLFLSLAISVWTCQHAYSQSPDCPPPTPPCYPNSYYGDSGYSGSYDSSGIPGSGQVRSGGDGQSRSTGTSSPPSTSSQSVASPLTTRPSVGSSGGQSNAQDLLAMGLSRGDLFTSSISPAGAGLGTATAMNAINQLDFTTAAISPGLLTSANIESAYVVDRVFFAYSYYDSFRSIITGPPIPSGDPAIPPTVPTRTVDGFNLNRFDVGFEKRIGDNFSFYFRAPFLDATDNITGVGIDGAGNLSTGIKAVLLSNRLNGNVLTAGMTVSVPTARETRVLSNVRDVFPAPALDFVVFNPTYLQPWLATRLNHEDFFAQVYSGLLISTDERAVSAYNGDLTVGANLYYNTHAAISSVTTLLSTQVLAPFDADDETLLDFDTQVLLSPGLEFGLGRKASLSTSLPIPIASPRAFDLGFSMTMNYFY